MGNPRFQAMVERALGRWPRAVHVPAKGGAAGGLIASVPFGPIASVPFGPRPFWTVRRHLSQERALGDPRFQTMVERALGRPAECRARGRPRAGSRAD